MSNTTTLPSAEEAPAPGHYGPFGGRYVPEILVPVLDELAVKYAEYKSDPAFQAELAALLSDYVGRPTPLTPATRLTEMAGGICFTAMTFGGGYMIAAFGYRSLFLLGAVLTSMSALVLWRSFRAPPV